MPKEIEKMKVLSALAGETRYRIVSHLMVMDKASVSAIMDGIGRSDDAVSSQLKLLLKDGIVEVKRHGRNRIYQIASTERGTMAKKFMRV